MNVQLDKRLGKIWMEVERRLSLEEIHKFRDAAVQAKSFNDLPQTCKDLVLEIESSSKKKAA